MYVESTHNMQDSRAIALKSLSILSVHGNDCIDIAYRAITYVQLADLFTSDGWKKEDIYETYSRHIRESTVCLYPLTKTAVPDLQFFDKMCMKRFKRSTLSLYRRNPSTRDHPILMWQNPNDSQEKKKKKKIFALVEWIMHQKETSSFRFQIPIYFTYTIAPRLYARKYTDCSLRDYIRRKPKLRIAHDKASNVNYIMGARARSSIVP